MCGAGPGGVDLEGAQLAGVDLTREAVIQGSVTRNGTPVGPAYVRLLDGRGDFTAEVPTDDDGVFRFFARPGTWTLRVLVPGASVERQVVASVGAITDLQVEV
jgi:hypothetical protein